MPRVEAEKKKVLADNPFVWIGLLVAIVVLGTVAYFMTFMKDYDADKGRVLAVVGNKKIYEQDLNEQIYGLDFKASPTNPVEVPNEVKKELLDKLVEWEIVRQEASKMDTKVTEPEIDGRIESLLGEDYQDYNSYQKRLTRNNVSGDILLEKITDKVVAWREGKFFIARFDRPYEYVMDLNDPQVIKDMEEEKAYAEKLINDLYNQVKDSKISFDEAMEIAANDSVIGIPTWGGENVTYNFSENFTKEDFIRKTYNAFSPNFWDIVYEIRKGEISKPQMIKVKNTDGVHDAFYAVIAVTEESDSNYRTYNDWLEAMKKEYKVQYKVQY